MDRSSRQTPAGLSPEIMWSAVVSRDARYDGRFFTAVRTTGIFCRPTCTCRKPRRENVAFYPSPAAAERAGYRPCKRCRPDLPGGPADADRTLAAHALAFMRSRLDQPLQIGIIADAVALSPSRFSRRFRAADGRTPARALADLRAERAESLLQDPALTVLDAGLDAGFQSASAFTRAFRRRTGMTPRAWRNSRRGGSRR